MSVVCDGYVTDGSTPDAACPGPLLHQPADRGDLRGAGLRVEHGPQAVDRDHHDVPRRLFRTGIRTRRQRDERDHHLHMTLHG